jgi:hypothetical protein
VRAWVVVYSVQQPSRSNFLGMTRKVHFTTCSERLSIASSTICSHTLAISSFAGRHSEN